MRLKTILSAAGAVGITAVLALGAAAPANAALDPNGSIHEPADARLVGPFNTFSAPYDDDKGRIWNAWSANKIQQDALIGTVARGFNGGVPAGGAEFTFPGVEHGYGTVNPVADPALCMTASGYGFSGTKPNHPVFLSLCDGSDLQQFSVEEDGTLLSKLGYGMSDYLTNSASYLYGLSTGYKSMFERLDLDQLSPVGEVPTANLTADISSANLDAKTAVIGGTGEPGATIKLEGPWGSEETIVDDDGNWSKEISGLVTGDNPVTVTQKVEGAEDQSKELNVHFDAAKLIGEVISVDADAKTAEVGGTGEPGEKLEITNPDGTTQEVVIDQDGNWSATVPGLVEGVNPIKVKNPATGEELPLEATLLPSPIVAPAIAGGAGIAALAALGTVLMVRRRNIVKQ